MRPRVTRAGCEECGVGPLELCDPCGERYDKMVEASMARRSFARRLGALPLLPVLWVVRGLRRLLERLGP